MARRFDRSDFDSRTLLGCYRSIGDRIGEEVVALRSFLHEKYYPEFGIAQGLQRRAIFRRLQGWNDIYRDYAERLFRHGFEVEENLVYSLALDGRADHAVILGRLRDYRQAADRLLRCLYARLKAEQAQDRIDTAGLYDLCPQIEQAAQFFLFAGQTLLSPLANDRTGRDPSVAGLDWRAIGAAIAGRAAPIEAEIILDTGDFERATRAAAVPPKLLPIRSGTPGDGDASQRLRRRTRRPS